MAELEKDYGCRTLKDARVKLKRLQTNAALAEKVFRRQMANFKQVHDGAKREQEGES